MAGFLLLPNGTDRLLLPNLTDKLLLPTRLTPALLQSATTISPDASSSVSVTLPTPPTTGNLLVIAVAWDKASGGTTVSPAGFTDVVDLSSTSVGLLLAYKVSDGTETTVTVTGTNAAASGADAWYAEYDDPSAGGTWELVASANNPTTEANVTTLASGTTGTLANAGVAIAAFATDTKRSVVSGSTFSNSYVPRYNDQNVDEGSGGLFVADKLEASSGGTTSTTWSFTGTADQVSGAVAVFRRTGGATVGTLSQRWVGVGKIKVKTSNATSVRLKVGTDSAVTTGVTYTSAQTPDAQGYTMHDVSGYAAGSTFYYRVAMTATAETLDTETTVGRFKTAPTSGGFAFNFASCSNGDSAAMTAIAARGDDLFLHMGDFVYADGSGTSLANFRAQWDAGLARPEHAKVLATTPTTFGPSDHDGLNNNWVGTGDTTARDNLNTVIREKTAQVPVPSTTGTYFAFEWGPICFIVCDMRSFKSANADTDNSSKTVLGATQKQWVKDTAAATSKRVVVIVGDTPLTGAANVDDDEWNNYNTERQDLFGYLNGLAPTKRIAYLHGDMHAVAADDGTNSGITPGVPSFCGAPLHQAFSFKAGPYTAGSYPTTGTVDQYGRIVVSETATSVTLAYTGYSSDNTARITQTTTFSFPTALTRSVGDAAAATDTLTRAGSSPRALADTAAASDTSTRSTSRTRAVTDSAPASDATTASVTRNVARTTSDTAAVADVTTRAAQPLARTAGDTGGATADVATRTSLTGRTTADTATTTDATAAASARARSTSESTTATDTTTRTGASARATSDTTAAADSTARTSARARGLADPAVLTDSTVGVRTGAPRTRSTSETLTFTDTAAASSTGNLSRTQTDTASATDATARTSSRIRSTSDQSATADAVAGRRGVVRTLGDVAAATDLAARAVATARAALDLVDLVDISVAGAGAPAPVLSVGAPREQTAIAAGTPRPPATYAGPARPPRYRVGGSP